MVRYIYTEIYFRLTEIFLFDVSDGVKAPGWLIYSTMHHLQGEIGSSILLGFGVRTRDMSTENVPEMSTIEAAAWLMLTPRQVLNYLKSRQLRGRKVAGEWYIEAESVYLMRPKEQKALDMRLPPQENPESVQQQVKKGIVPEKWKRYKVQSNRKSLGSFRAFVRLKEAYDLLQVARAELKDTFLYEVLEFAEKEMVLVSDSLGRGYYSPLGLAKLERYHRARLRAGRLVSRLRLVGAPEGISMVFQELADALVSLCIRMENPKNKLVNG